MNLTNAARKITMEKLIKYTKNTQITIDFCEQMGLIPKYKHL